MKRTLAVLALMVLLFSFSTIWASDDDILKADQYFNNAKQPVMINEAISTLEALVAKEPENYQALWRLARFYQYLGDQAPKKEKIATYEKGKAYGERAIKVNEQGVEGHLWVGTLIGNIGTERGILQSLANAKPMRIELEKALKLDPKNTWGYYVIAQLYWKLPGAPLSFGDKKKALELSALSVKYGPEENVSYWLIYGQIAADNKEYKTARIAFKKVLNFPGDHEEDSKTAQEELNKLPKE